MILLSLPPPPHVVCPEVSPIAPFSPLAPFPRKQAPAMVGGRRNRPRVGVQSGGIRGRGCDRRCQGIWWDRVYKRIVVQGVDFIEDTQDGVGDEFELIPG
ncbi:hypothetical protein PVAP13_7NG133517 [Panicum virgatum]|uniref:Uncharacterized protein n=1 Tax=Panicum virgatum TaxID=38727 RepID=A0A8T0PXU1_PANVG|nr:hypothetical protein PVAP13_7NG133517 [Panicum virgatum]